MFANVGTQSKVLVGGAVLLSAVLYATDFASPDGAKWTRNWLGTPSEVTAPPNPSYELEAFDPARVAYTAQGLQISIRADPIEIHGTSYPFRSGAVTGYQKQAYLYGYFSARIYVPCSGDKIVNWPAFWLVGDPYKWPATGEIDVFEGLGGAAWWHFHYQDKSGSPASFGGKAAGTYCGWHNFAVDWRATAIRWYYDGRLVGTVTSSITSSPMFPVFSYSVTDPASRRCVSYPDACGGAIDTSAVMEVASFIARD